MGFLDTETERVEPDAEPESQLRAEANAEQETRAESFFGTRSEEGLSPAAVSGSLPRTASLPSLRANGHFPLQNRSGKCSMHTCGRGKVLSKVYLNGRWIWTTCI